MIIKMVPLSGEKFHFALLKTVLSAPMSFFVNTDSGVTLNRFSQDLQLIDMELPLSALNTFTSTQASRLNNYVFYQTLISSQHSSSVLHRWPSSATGPSTQPSRFLS
jgi:hypothetical protein